MGTAGLSVYSGCTSKRRYELVVKIPTAQIGKSPSAHSWWVKPHRTPLLLHSLAFPQSGKTR